MATPTLDEVISASQRDASDVLNVFLVGSRAWGTHDAQSDWDIFVVVKDEVSKLPLEMTDDGTLNLSIFSESSWRRWLVRDHNLQGIACLYLPSANVLLNRKNWKEEFVLDEKRLKFAALRKASSSMNRARIYWMAMLDMFAPLERKRIELTEEDAKAMGGLTRKEAVKKSKKMIAHCFRNIYFAQQLFATGHITDLHAVVPLWQELLLEPFDVEWSHYAAKYETLHHKLIDTFPTVCKEAPDLEKQSMPPTLHQLLTLAQLPPFQSSYRQGIEKELFALIRLEKSTSSPSNNPDAPSSSEQTMEELIANHFDDSISSMYLAASTFYDSMAQLLSLDFSNLMTLVSKLTSKRGTKPGQEIAALAKPVPHYTLLFGMWKTENANGDAYLATCPWTHFDMMEKYMRTNPAPLIWIDPTETTPAPST